MQWRLTDEQVDYQQSLREWLSKTADGATVRRWLDDGDTDTFAARFDDEGWGGVGIPEEQGGEGGGLIELALGAEELGRACAPSATWLARAVAAPLLPGRPGVLLAPADAIPHRATALRLDGRGRVSGAVPRVLAAAAAATFVVPVIAADGTPVLVAVEAAAATITSRRPLDRSRPVADVDLDGVPAERLDVDVSSALREASGRAAVLVAADALGASERMLDLAVEYAGQRHQFGVPIGSFQAVKHAAATILVGVEAARSVVLFAAASVDRPTDERDPRWLLHAAAAKSQVTAEAVRAADSALTLHGAIGYTWEHDLQLFYKRAGLDKVLAGSPAAWDDVIADGLALA